MENNNDPIVKKAKEIFDELGGEQWFVDKLILELMKLKLEAVNIPNKKRVVDYHSNFQEAIDAVAASLPHPTELSSQIDKDDDFEALKHDPIGLILIVLVLIRQNKWVHVMKRRQMAIDEDPSLSAYKTLDAFHSLIREKGPNKVINWGGNSEKLNPRSELLISLVEYFQSCKIQTAQDLRTVFKDSVQEQESGFIKELMRIKYFGPSLLNMTKKILLQDDGVAVINSSISAFIDAALAQQNLKVIKSDPQKAKDIHTKILIEVANKLELSPRKLDLLLWDTASKK